MRIIFMGFMLFSTSLLHAQVTKILFDATKAQMAGNADWVIDADVNNIGYNSIGTMVTGLGDEANPQGIPTPGQSGITASTLETYWNGALSAWAVDCVKKGYKVETLPYNDSITYGNTAHARDLSNYNVYIVDEPNILYTLSEKNAIVNFVKNGGGLFIISDHDVSDRNGDGFDSPTIWNDLFTTNTVQTNPFGITFDLQNFSQTSTNVATIAGDSCLHGPMGNVTKIQYSGGTSMTLNAVNNSTVKGLIYKTGSNNTGNTQALFARAYYGDGKVCAMGDSSPADDGTGDANDVLYNGYTGDANGEHQLLLMNATIWLATNHKIPASLNNESLLTNIDVQLFPNPSNGDIQIQWHATSDKPVQFEVTDIYGNVLLKSTLVTSSNGQQEKQIHLTSKGFFILKINTENRVEVKSFLVN